MIISLSSSGTGYSLQIAKIPACCSQANPMTGELIHTSALQTPQNRSGAAVTCASRLPGFREENGWNTSRRRQLGISPGVELRGVNRQRSERVRLIRFESVDKICCSDQPFGSTPGSAFMQQVIGKQVSAFQGGRFSQSAGLAVASLLPLGGVFWNAPRTSPAGTRVI